MYRDPIASAPGGPQAAPRTASACAPLPPEFAALARLAASVCHARFASVALIGSGQAWYGLDEQTAPKRLAEHDPFFDYAKASRDVFTVANTTRDKRFRGVTSAFGVRSYAGCALRSADGELSGILAVYHTAARAFSEEQRNALKLIAQQCIAQAELRARVAELELLCGAQAAGPAAPPQPAAPAQTTDGEPGDTAIDAALARALIESAPVAIYHADINSDISYINPEYRRVFGLTPEQSPNDWALGVHPEDRRRMEDTWGDFCRVPRPMRFEYRSVPKQGVVRYFAEQVVPTRDGSGHVGTISDFTDLVTMRDNLRKAETLFRQHVRPGADRHRVCGPRRQISALQRCVLRTGRFYPRGIRGQVDRRADASRGCRERSGTTRALVERRDQLHRHREALRSQGRQQRVGSHDHGAGSRRQHHSNARSNIARHNPSKGSGGGIAAAADAARRQ